MSLYQLPLPPQELIPIAIPEHIHPLFVHFAIALPIVILIIELYNLIARRRSIAVLSLLFMVLLAVVIFGAILTGATDAKLANVSSEVKDIILEHKAIATYLLYGVGVLIILKLLSMFVAKNLFKIAYVIFTIIFIAVTFYNGKLGGSLVYEHGVNVKGVAKEEPKAVSSENKESLNSKKSEESEANESKKDESNVSKELNNTNDQKEESSEKEVVAEKNITNEDVNREENTIKNTTDEEMNNKEENATKESIESNKTVIENNKSKQNKEDSSEENASNIEANQTN